jgi:hypothetical protein
LVVGITENLIALTKMGNSQPRLGFVHSGLLISTLLVMLILAFLFAISGEQKEVVDEMIRSVGYRFIFWACVITSMTSGLLHQFFFKEWSLPQESKLESA